MAQSIKRQRHIRKILTAAVGPTLGGELYSTVTKWEQSCGSEWTVTRLKALRTVALQLRAGNPYIAQDVLRETGIAFKCPHGSPIVKGPWGQVILQFINAKRPSVLRRLSALFRIYTCVYLPDVSKAQLDKAKSAIGDGAKVTPKWRENNPNVIQMRKNLNLFPGTVKVPRPDLGRLKANSSYYRTMRSGNSPWSKAVGSLLSSVYIPDSLKDHNPCEEFREALENAGADAVTPGRIAFLQEGGAKARVVATPNVWLQWLFEPLHKALDTLIRRLPHSAVHDQTRGGWFLQENIGKPMWCFDLSSATDRFPRSLQIQVLGWLGLEHYGNALEEVSTSPWKFQEGTISYGAGQPMGLYGSFPLFHLTHYTLLETAAVMAGYKPGAPRPFMVLGDDVIITDQHVAEIYRRELDRWDVPVSPTKSIASSDVGEFAGFLALRTNKGSCVFRPYKFKADGIKNPLSLLHSLGGNVRYLGPYWAKMFDIFARTLKSRDLDLSPLVGEDRDGQKRPPKLDSHFLGSLVMRLSYDTPYDMPDSLLDMWSEVRLTLLGNKEVTDSDGIPLKNLNPMGIGLPDREEERYSSPYLRILADPLMKALRYVR